jgi:hypothetical protein
MTANTGSTPASIFRPLVFALLAVALLACGVFQSVSAYPGPAALNRLVDALSAAWAAMGFLAGLTMLLVGLVLLTASVYRLRRLGRPALSSHRGSQDPRGSSSPPPGHRPGEEFQFEPHPDDDDRFAPGQEPDPYEGDYQGDYRGPGDRYGDECVNGYAHPNDNGHDPGRRRSRDRARFEQRRWAGAPR